MAEVRGKDSKKRFRGWTLALVKSGMERFLRENGHLPDWKEVNTCPYLPSTRQIQDRFGGLKTIKRKLGYSDLSYGVGAYRSAIASRTGKRGLDHEIEIERILVSRFGEMFVHSEKRFGATRRRVDFYVYTLDGPFAVDVFDSDDIHSFVVHLNIKLRKYAEFPSDLNLLLVCMNRMLTEQRIADILLVKERRVPPNFRVLTQPGLLETISGFRPYPARQVAT